ncbi:MAPEG family protein [Parasphingorhabdus sp.]|uniref:MAPEG family protein n=1 Tax=Parasphingorhabdus sp. TaxID=2709688 RepID=UPI002F92B10A
MILPITLTIAGVAALINIWLMLRVGRVRTSEKISVGDGGNEFLLRRMRAHSNYGESMPIVLILIGVIEMASLVMGDGAPLWLWLVGGVYMLGRVAHGIGMDGGKLGVGRAIGTVVTLLVMVGLAAYAISIPYLTIPDIPAAPVTTAMLR